MANRPDKISRDDFLVFAVKTYEASSAMLDFSDWYEIYEEILRVIFWNPEVDTQMIVGGSRRG